MCARRSRAPSGSRVRSRARRSRPSPRVRACPAGTRRAESALRSRTRCSAPPHRSRRVAPSCRRTRTRRRRCAVRARARVARRRSRGPSYHATVGFAVMAHGDLAQFAAVVGGVGAAIMLLARMRLELLAGLAVALVGEVLLAVALIPGHDLRIVVTPASHLAAFSLGLVFLGGAAWTFVR